ncbi:Glyoxylate reductase [Flexistipes sinusarabici DSM 4947]|uniref:Glyoxylate reductase n=1 Tax=Flexistipes sinusarabici (strain ATCC 49648 / DSM 4947 / MAS 10) TaxID=717231 RepID=F8E3Z3_FLESM|nr:D-glycerate dehydrogenase [Flexistipes sinusarabici]AEI15495.1 Glyoxylate reductase [Flexistipes sinusarabici DSM 4947]
MKKIIVTKKLPFDIEDSFKNYDLIYNKSSEPLSEDELQRELYDADAVISMLSDKINAKMLENAGNLKVVANYAVGFNNIDIDYCSEKNIVVCNTPHVLTEATAELGFALLISAARRIVEADKFVRQGKFKGWEPTLFLGHGLQNKTLGIYGFGKIGQTLGNFARNFKMNVIYNSRSRKRHEEKLIDAQYVTFEHLLDKSDFLVVTAPLNTSTKHRFTKNEFEKMRSSSVFINLGRGEIVRESDLAEALENGEITYAGLDVYEFEPSVNKKLLNMDNVILLPHIGSATVTARKEMAKLCIKSVKKVLEKNNVPWNAVNKNFIVDK